MSRRHLPRKRRALVSFAWVLVLWVGHLHLVFAQVPKGFETAAAAFNAGNFPEAERLLRAALAASPDEVYGLDLLAVVLDREQKYQEAEAVYRSLLRRTRNPFVLNNLANHYLASGQREKGIQYYRETLRLNPRDPNANAQLAALDVEDRKPVEALAHLRMLPEAEQHQPAMILLRGRAEIEMGQREATWQTLAPLEAAISTDPSMAFSLGLMYSKEKLYPDAARAFEAALRQEPSNFEILYNLGLAYHLEGQRERAAEVLGRAVRVNSRSADALYHLALVMSELGQHEVATEFLIRAREMAPQRAELSLLLAHECATQQFWPDAAEAYEAYLRLKPDDWDATKELAFLYIVMKHYAQALPHLDGYVAARPHAPHGFYLRGLVSWHLRRPAAASADFRRALELDPRLAEAWSRLGEIAREQNDLNEAERLYRKALEIQPDEANALYGLALVLNARQQFRDAIPLLRKASEVRAEEPAAHYQLSIAYRRLGLHDRAQAELDKFQQLWKKSGEQTYFRSGLVTYLEEGMKLSDSERQTRELTYLERAVAIKLGEAAIRARLVDGYLKAGQKHQAEEAIQQWLETDAGGQAELQAGEILARHGEYEAAIPHFTRASPQESTHFAARMGLAAAEFHLGHYDKALQLLEPLTPPPEAALGYQLLRAATLDKVNRFDAALAAYQQAIRLDPPQEAPYIELGLFFVNHLAYDAALENFRAAQKLFPQSLNLGQAEAIVLSLAGRHQEAMAKLHLIQARWPEQDWPYLLAGIAAYMTNNYEDAQLELERAAGLGSDNPSTYYYLALVESESSPPNLQVALRWTEMALQSDPNFAQAHFLRGKLCEKLGRTAEARQALEEAVRLQPSMVEAHYLLSRVYAELGDVTRADAEARESDQLRRAVQQVNSEKETILRLLVRVETPH